MSTNLIKDDELSRLMWSIGDRYHDWWPASRGIIESYKNCGVWGMIPVLIHYGIVCDSVIAFKKKYDRIMQPQPQPHINALSALNAAAFNKDFAISRVLTKKGAAAAAAAAAKAEKAEKEAKALAATHPKFQNLNKFFKTVYTRQERGSFENLINTSIQKSIFSYVEEMNNGSEEKENYSWTDGNLAKSAEYTLGYFGGVSTIEDDILNRFTQGIPNILMNVTQIRNNLDIMIANYREICEQLFGDLTNVKWFAVLCDADIGPFCKLFDDILQTNATAAATAAAAAAALTLNPIIQYCNTKNIPVMYMIKTPQTISDSSDNQSFRPCLTLYRFPITHTRADYTQNFSQAPEQPPPPDIQDMPHPGRNQPGIPANQAGIPNNPAAFYNNNKFDSNLNSLVEGYNVSYRAGVPPAADGSAAIPYTFDDKIGGSSFIYRIEGPPSAVPNAADAAAAPAALRFDIPYGSLQGYRASGPSLGDLMLHYIHKNLKDFDDSNPKGFPDDSSSIFSKDINYLNEPFKVFKHGEYDQVKYIEGDNGKNAKAIEPVRIYSKLNDIRRVVDSSLGIRPPDGKGDIKEDSYTITPHNSLYLIPNYDKVPAVIMTVIKLLGDYDQAVAARVLNKTTEFHNRIVFCSIDRSCVAHSANNGVRTIQILKKNDIIVYNGTPAAPAPAPAAPAAPAAKKQKPKHEKPKQNGGFKNTLDDCDNQCLDIKQTMLTAGMNASRYLLLYKKYIKSIEIDDYRHSDVLLDIYNEIRHKYNMYNRDLQNDITDFNIKYDNNNMRVFMGILNDLYYNHINKNKSLKILIALCNIHNRNYMLPEIDYMKYVKNTNSLSQQLRKNLSYSRKKSSQPHKKLSLSHNKSASQLREQILQQLHKKSSLSHKKLSHKKLSHKKSGQSRKKSSLHKIMAPVAGGF